MEESLEQILNELKELRDDVNDLKNGQKHLNQRLDEVESQLSTIGGGILDKLENYVDIILMFNKI